MRKIILNLSLTLDGFIEGPNGELDWLARDEEIDFADILNDMLSDKTLFFTAGKLRQPGNFQPDANASQKIKEAYKLLHSKQKYVFSKTKKDDDTNAIFINSGIEERVLEIKEQPGKNI